MDHWLRILKSSLFACFGAGIGIALFISLSTFGEMFIVGDALPFDCSTLEYCGLSFGNTALAIIYAIVGTALLALFASMIGALYAIPAVLALGSFLYFRVLRQRALNSRYLAYFLGAVGGVLWWVLLDMIDMLPFISDMREGYPDNELASGPNSMMLIAAAAGGVVSAEMFLRWLKTELVELDLPG